MDDRTLIETFLQDFVAGKPALLANPRLKTDVAFDTVQLISSNEGRIFLGKPLDRPLAAQVKQSVYWEIIHPILVSHSILPLESVPENGFYRYQFRTIPDGYEVHCTDAKELWRRCWARGTRSRYGIPIDLLILHRGPLNRDATWYPVRDISIHHGGLYIKTIGGEIELNSTDLIVWLTKDREVASKRPTYRR